MSQKQKSRDILVIARKRGFWSSKAFEEVFPFKIFLKSTPTKIEQLWYGVLGLFLIFWYKPKVLILGTSMWIVRMYTFLRRYGLLKNIKIIADKQYLKIDEVRYLDRIIVYSPGEIDQYPDELKSKFIFLHYPSKTELVKIAEDKVSGDYIFCGGSNMRDHKTFLEAVRDLPVKVVVVTDKPLPNNIPNNCQVFGRMPLDRYMNVMAGSLFVVVPLLESKLPHGHCDISSALSLGKPVITTAGASADRYVIEEENGLFVKPGDVADCRQTIERLWNNRDLLGRMSGYTAAHACDFSYPVFAKKILALCQ